MKSTAGGWVEILEVTDFQYVIQIGRVQNSGMRQGIITQESVGGDDATALRSGQYITEWSGLDYKYSGTYLVLDDLSRDSVWGAFTAANPNRNKQSVISLCFWVFIELTRIGSIKELSSHECFVAQNWKVEMVSGCG